MKILTAKQMREADRITIEELGIPGLTLMENAGQGVFQVLQDKFPALEKERITVLCGKGNNGGDGLVVARYMKINGLTPQVYLFADPSSMKGEARTNYERLLEAGVKPIVIRDFQAWTAVRDEIASAKLIIDALLGTGLEGPVEGFYKEVIQDLNENLAKIPILAVDMPSGLPSDCGDSAGESLSADYTVTFTAPKVSQIFPPNCWQVGELIVAQIGTPLSVMENDASIFLNLIGQEELSNLARKRIPDSHKGDYGHVLVVGGSRGKSGAAGMAALAALRAGAGLVTAAVPSSVLPLVAGVSPALMTEPLPETAAGTISLRSIESGEFDKIIKGKTVLALGPGISTDQETSEFVRTTLERYPNLPTVLDADGLNAFADSPDLLRGDNRILVVTPHPGEMARLTGKSITQIQSQRVKIARDFAMRHRVFVVLKGYRTLIAEPGGQVYVNPTGNAGMATAGTGDVLTGIIAGLLAQNLDEQTGKVISAAVYWHGAAGDAAEEHTGELSLIATDLIAAMPEAMFNAGGDR
ncbi:MAG: hypothetical protein A3F68_13405 [Acidobacteria bacterium RIFCSPLOWO2_12_FULL_54_10]|nr:MAG: hypothetical protein A3F68_13405 [Acidobacteria bacterium RIFCSPLOWO2_12_FULL_54_10]